MMGMKADVAGLPRDVKEMRKRRRAATAVPPVGKKRVRHQFLSNPIPM